MVCLVESMVRELLIGTSSIQQLPCLPFLKSLNIGDFFTFLSLIPPYIQGFNETKENMTDVKDLLPDKTLSFYKIIFVNPRYIDDPLN